MQATMNDRTIARKPGQRWAIPAASGIDLLLAGHRFAGGSTALLKAALFIVGYLLTVGSVVAFFAHYIGWSPSLLIAGVSHVALAVFGLSSVAVAGPEAPEAEQDVERQDVVTPIVRTQSVRPRPPAFPPRTRSAP